MEEKKNNAMEKVENIINGSNKSPTIDAEKRAEKVGEKQRRIALHDKLKAERKEYKNREKQKNPNGKNGWKTGAITLGVATLVLASVLISTYIFPSATDRAMESAYRRAFYGTVEQVDGIDANLSKAILTTDTGALQTYLVDTAIQSELCENDIGELPLRDESKYYTAKLVNQIGDFCKYLNKKLIDGESVSLTDKQTLRTLRDANLELKNSLQKTMREMDGDFSFRQMADGGVGNAVTRNFNDLQNLSQNFPELIYDGPFSDGLNNREIKGLSGDKIDKAKAVKIFERTFMDRGVKNATCTGKTDGEIVTFNIKGEVKGDEIYAEITETGGKLLMFSFVGECNKVVYGEEEAIKSAKAFLKELGIENMEAVWVNLANNLYTINFAYQENGVIVYSDLIKVRVCAETCGVIGIEATTYYTNHTPREIETPTLSSDGAKSKISLDIEVKTQRLCLVPIGTKTEKLCYEFSGEVDGDTYYIYIDAKSGRQVEMFRVVDSTEGKLLV